MTKNFMKTSVLLLFTVLVSIPAYSQETSKDTTNINSSSVLFADQIRCFKYNSDNNYAVFRCP